MVFCFYKERAPFISAEYEKPKEYPCVISYEIIFQEHEKDILVYNFVYLSDFTGLI
jgi:hypothetical protein